MIPFAASLLLLLSTPGPGVLSLAGVGSAYGYRAGWIYGAGLFVGSNAVMLAAAMGLAAAVLADARLQIVFAVLSTAYLLYLALKIAFAGSRIAFIEANKPPGFWGGIALQVINPKAYAVGMFVFSNFPIWPDNRLIEIVLKFAILNAVWVPIHSIWLAAGVAINRLELPGPVQHKINIAMAVAMLVVVGLAVWSLFFGVDNTAL